MPLRALAPPLLVLVLLAALAGPAASPADAAAKRCTRGTVALTLDGRRVCASTPKRGATATLKALATPTVPRAKGRFTARHRRLLLSPAATKLRKRVDRAMQPLGRAAAVRTLSARAAAASPCSGGPPSPSTTTTRAGGTTSTVGGGMYGSSREPTNGILLTVQANDGNGLSLSQTMKSCVTWEPCPSPGGVVQGTYVNVVQERREATVEGSTAVVVTSAASEVDVTAQVGDDARAKHYNHVISTAFQVGAEVRKGGKLVQRLPTRSYRVHGTSGAIDPRSPGRNVPVGSMRGPKGSVPPHEVGALKSMVDIAVDALGETTSRALLAAEEGWRSGECLTVRFDPATAEVEPGQQLPVDVSITRKDGSPAAVPFTANPIDGALTVPQGPAPQTLTWTAPQQLDAGTFGTFRVETTSRQGIASGDHTARRKVEALWTARLLVENEYVWNYESLRQSSLGTDSSCTEVTTGGGRQVISIGSDGTGPAGRAGLTPDGRVWLGLAPRSGTIEQQGTFGTLAHGSASSCKSSAWGSSGCGLELLEAVNADFAWAAGVLTPDFSNVRTPGFGDCPLWETTYGVPLAPGLADTSTGQLPAAWLSDPARDEIVVTGGLRQVGREDCAGEGSPGCDDDPPRAKFDYHIDADQALRWTLRLTREK